MSKRVRITKTKHPHAGETGTLTGERIMVYGKLLLKIELDNCPKGVNSCFIAEGDATHLKGNEE